MKRKTFLLSACLALLIPLLFLSVCAVALPAKYDATYMGELKYKCERLSSARGPKIVLVGGSSCAFGVDSALIEAEFPDYEVVNLGMYAALGSRMMLDLARDSIGRGDIVIFLPEINKQTLSDFTDGTYALQGLDGAWHLLARIRPDLYPSLIGAMPAFAMEKLHYQLRGTLPEPGALYRRSSFNESGDIDNTMVSRNIMPEEYDPDLPVYFDSGILTQEFADYLNDYARRLGKKGAALYYHFCPVNELSASCRAGADDGQVSGAEASASASAEAPASADTSTSDKASAEASAQNFYADLDSILDFPVLGDPRASLMEAGWFYDTNFHLNRAGKTAFTRQLIRDIKAALGDTSATEIAVPAMPRTLAFMQMPDDGDSVLKRSVYAGNTTVTEITVPAAIRRIEDGAFDGCTALQIIHLESADPTGILVGRHLLDGTDAVLCVPAKALSAYRTDYRFSQYADRIRGE